MGMDILDGSESDNEDVSKIEINEEFARRYMHNKDREILQQREERKKKGLIDESDSDIDDEDDFEDDDFINSSKKNVEFFDALIKVKKQDPVLKQKDATLFKEDSEESGEEEGAGEKKVKEKKGKAVYLKDVVARQLIEEGPEYEEDESMPALKKKTYNEEQEELRREFLKAAEDVETGDLLKAKENEDDGEGDEDDEDVEVQNKLDEYFGKDDELDENAIFLKEYFSNKMWIDREKDRKAIGEELDVVSEDEEAIEDQEDYERGYNFRFEENAGDRVLGHARVVDGSVRKRRNARKVQRQSKGERMAIAEAERKELLKHLKNLKKKEYMEKLNKVREIGGLGENDKFLFDMDDFDEEFDLEKHDRKMKKVFNEDYYGVNDIDPDFGSDGDEEDDGLEKPNFDEEDELLGLPKDWDVCKYGKGVHAAREVAKEKALNSNVDIEGGQEEEEEEEDEEGEEAEEPENAEDNRKRKRKLSLGDKMALVYKKELEEELYKLDYEDTIEDLKTRFKYQKVGATRYGLTPEELLLMDDKELNQYVSLKKLAPHVEKEWKVPSMKRSEQKKRNKVLFKRLKEQNTDKKKKSKDSDQSLTGKKKRSKDSDHSLKDQKTGEKKKSKDLDLIPVTDALGDGKEKLEKSNDDVASTSRKSRRRRRQSELKLSKSRLQAYGKIPPNHASKAKH